MKKPDLYRFFSGQSTEIEKKELRIWLDSNPSHFDIFQRERQLYNSVILHTDEVLVPEEKNSKHPIRLKKLLLQFSKVAAIFLLAYISSYFISNWKQSDTDKSIAYQTIHVPFGQRINLDLPDGTKVWLNAGTTIRYPISFNEKLREVSLEGEAYFEVSKKEELPFRVTAGDYVVEVLGTKFNVETDKSNNVFKTSLFEGAVKVFDQINPAKSTLLEPNTSVSLKDGELHTESLTNLNKYAWKDGILSFDKEPFEEIMSVFEKSFGCKIIVENKQVKQYLYKGKFLQTDGIDYALHLLQKNISFTYSRDKETNTIIIK